MFCLGLGSIIALKADADAADALMGFERGRPYDPKVRSETASLGRTNGRERTTGAPAIDLVVLPLHVYVNHVQIRHHF